MSTAITIVGVAGSITLMILVVLIVGAACAKVFEKATERVIMAATLAERKRVASHYHATSWWFSEYPDVQHAMALVAEELATDRCDSSRLRDEWKRKTGRNNE